MAPIKREVLKRYFERGQIPTQNQFEELIDSILNLVDDDYIRFNKEGFAIYSKKAGDDGGIILEIYKTKPSFNDTDKPFWTLSLDKNGNLSINSEEGKDITFETEKIITSAIDITKDMVNIKKPIEIDLIKDFPVDKCFFTPFFKVIPMDEFNEIEIIKIPRINNKILNFDVEIYTIGCDSQEFAEICHFICIEDKPIVIKVVDNMFNFIDVFGAFENENYIFKLKIDNGLTGKRLMVIVK